MQSIQDIIDTTLSLGFSWFYGLVDDQGYLRRMLRTNPTLESLYVRLKDDIDFISDADEDYFKNESQLKAFKKLKKYLIEAKHYVKTQLKKKKKKSKNELKDIKKEIADLEKELQDPFLSEEEKEQIKWEIRSLLQTGSDNLDEVKSKFKAIDHKVKQELKKIGYEEEDLENEESELDDIPFEENTKPDINKLVDDNNRRYTMGEFNDLYQDMEKVEEAQEVQTKTIDPVQKNLDLKAAQLKKAEIQKIMNDAMKNKQKISPKEAEKIYLDRQAVRSNSTLK